MAEADDIFAPFVAQKKEPIPQSEADAIFAPFKELGPQGATPKSGTAKPPSVTVADIFKPEEGADYETGAPMSHRWNLFRASSHAEPNNKSEQELYLESRFGKGNYKRDQGGTWLVKPNWDKNQDATYEGPRGAPVYHDPATAPWTAVFPKGARGTMENIGVGAAAGLPAMAGAVGGAAAGTAVGGPVGGVAGAFAGSGFSHVADEGVKALQGFYNKSPLELAGDTALEGGLNALFQGAGPAWNASRNHLYNTTSQAIQRWTGVTPETRALTQGLEAYGVTPPVKSIAPRAKALEYDRRQRNMTTGDPMAAERAAVVDERIGEVLDTSGMSPQQRARAVQYINDTNVADTPGQSGQMVRDAITARNEASQQLQDAYVEDAHRALDRATSVISRNIAARPGTRKVSAVEAAGSTARSVVDDIEGVRAEFGAEMNLAASNFHNSAGGAPIVDIAATVPLVHEFLHPTPAPFRNILNKADARNVTPEMPPENVAPDATVDEIAAVLKWMQEKNAAGVPPTAGMGPVANDNPVMVTIEEAHRLRSSLMEMVRLRGDTDPIGMRRGEIYRIVGAIDSAMDHTALEAGGTVGAGMRDFNRRWAEGIVRFTNDDMNYIMRQTKAGRPPDPGVVADAIMNRKSLAATKQIYDMLSPETQFAVQQADLQNILKSATIPVGKFGRPTLDPDALLEALAERASLHRFMYGRNEPFIKNLEELAVTFKAAGGQVELDSLPQFRGNVVPFGRSPVGVTNAVHDIRNSLYAARDEQVAIRREVEHDALGSLRSNDPKLVDGGVRYILESEARTARAAEVLGQNSPEWQLLQREAVVHMLRSAVVKTPTGIGRTVNSRALDNALSGLTERQQAMLLPGPLHADIRLLSQQARMLFPELAESEMGGSIAAAQTLGNLPKANALRRWTWSQVAGYIADSPAVARMLAGTIRDDPYRGRRLLGYMMQTGVNIGVAGANQAGGTDVSAPTPSFDQQMRDLKTLESVHAPVPKKGYKGPSD